MVLALVAFLIWTQGRGGRGFFSPDTLEMRTQSECLLPPTEIPIYRSSYGYYRPKLADYLVENGYWSPIETENPHWVLMFHWNRRWRGGETGLYRAFRHKWKWIAWTEAHPEMASAFWPCFLAFLRSGEDPGASHAPYLMWYAEQCESVEAFLSLVESDPDLPDGVKRFCAQALAGPPEGGSRRGRQGKPGEPPGELSN